MENGEEKRVAAAGGSFASRELLLGMLDCVSRMQEIADGAVTESARALRAAGRDETPAFRALVDLALQCGAALEVIFDELRDVRK